MQQADVIVPSDGELAAQLAEAAGRILLAVRDSALVGGKALGKAGDHTANAFLIEALTHQRPEDGLLSEESKDTPERLAKDRVWIIDPVDGTREYGEIGPDGPRGDWAVHVALAVGGKPVLGAVALPGLGLVLRSDQPASLPPAGGQPRMVVSRSRPSPLTLGVAQALGAQTIPMGSAGAKAMAVVRGEADIYLHSGGQYEWDSCAPVAVALAHGLHASRIDGSPLVYNQPNTWLPDLLICRPEYAGAVLAAVRDLEEG
ncbi:MAG: 3'(2'),5'-bisphosphate nucleotidase CysQ [Sphingomonadales bacterium]|nr:3'(2'),5'-bisphosphate nucleotidase CysQ [Sphingomonadales bacterium]MDE2168948.1 3'(2'),5'-bisphosphate nucleotidase CysQ [Sphingomonadales bacterium]